jgi:hypothetical protein
MTTHMYLGTIPIHYYQIEFPPLSDECIEMLFHKQFINKALKWGQEMIEYSRLVSHLSFENENFSRRVCRTLLIGLGKANAEEALPLMRVTEQILNIQDSLFNKRLEWLLGIPHIKIDKPANYQVAQGQPKIKFGV